MQAFQENKSVTSPWKTMFYLSSFYSAQIIIKQLNIERSRLMSNFTLIPNAFYYKFWLEAILTMISRHEDIYLNFLL